MRASIALAAVAAMVDGCAERPERPVEPRIGQWIWTRADLVRFSESARDGRNIDAAVFIGAVSCEAESGRLRARAGLPASAPQRAAVTVVIRMEDGLERCRPAEDHSHRFDAQLDSAVSVLRRRVHGTRLTAVQLDYDAPQRGLAAWASSVAYLRDHALRNDELWITSLITHLRQPGYGDLFRSVVRGHVLQVFDTGEPSTSAQVNEAVRLATRADMPFRLGLGAFERETRSGPTDHRAWFDAVPRFADVNGYRGIWVFPAGRAWISLIASRT